ncbi:MAG: hypothetical protein H7141_08805 [Burkholderiales bacterium]|nr:hypothetical protein [Bacteroidia bacterium]
MKTPKINIKEEFIADIRAFKAPDLAKTILKNNQVTELIALAFEKDHLLSSRAMWVIGHCSDLDYNCIKPYHVKLINRLKNKDLHNGVIRNTLRLYQKHSVPKKSEPFILDKCFEYVKNPLEAIAVRAFAITVIFNIAKPYPELLNELLIVLNHMSETEEGSGIRSRVKNTIKDIHKLKLRIL